MFTQVIDPLDNLTLTCLVALIPVVSLLVMLAVFRVPAWLATLLGSLITFALAAWVWRMPLDDGTHAYLYGAATGVWNVDWITLWGMVLFNTMSVTGLFENFRRWLIALGGMDGMKGGWPLAVVGSLGYIAGQYPVARYWGPYLPDVVGAIVCFAALLVLLKLWQPKTVLGYGGVPVDAAAARQTQSHGLKSGEVLQAWLPFVVLLVVVGLWTGPWWGDHSPTKISLFKAQAVGCSALASTCTAAKPSVTAVFNFTPLIAGTAILTTWIIVLVMLIAMGRLKGGQLGEVLRRSFHQMWGACLVGVFIFGLAYTFNYSGMAASLAKGFSSMGTAFIIVAPVLGFIGVALSGSNTSTNAMFGKFQALVGAQLGMPPLLLPTLNSVGAEIGKPIAPQTASVGVSTSKFVRKEGDVIRHNMGWTFILLAYLIIIAIGFYLARPAVMTAS